MTTDNTVLSQPAPAEVVQPDTAVAESTGVSDQPQETTNEVSEAARTLAAQKKRNQENAFTRMHKRQEQLEAQNAQLLQAVLAERQRAQQPQPEPQGDGEPTRDQFDSYEEFVVAKAKHESNKLWHQRMTEAARYAQQAQAQQQEQFAAREHAKRVEEFAKKTPDFDAVIEQAADLELPPVASRAITRIPNGAQVLYEIAKNPAIVRQLHSMPGEAQLFFLGQMSAGLAARPLQISNAPSPGKPVGASSTNATPTDVKNMNRDQYYDHITKGAGRKKR